MADLKDVSFTDRYNGTAVGDYYDAIILRTSNGGISWNTQYFSETEELYGVSFIDSCVGTAVGYPGKILRTTDAGQTWQIQTSGTTARLYDVTSIDAENLFVVGEGGRIIKTTNGGLIWSTVWSAPKTLLGVSFASDSIGFAVGADGLIIKTTNYGQDWTVQQSGTSVDLYSVSFSNENIGVVVGGDYSGIVLKTTNGGSSWTNHLLTQSVLRSVNLINDSVGYICGSYGTIIKTITGRIITEVEEVTSINTLKPENYFLEQNFPNPFNPVTKIKYSVPQSGEVTLKVYDLLGKEIATLVNAEKPAGEYEVEFNAASHSGNARNLPSGIYFYQLKAGSYSETKKMVLLR
ncbi:MAG TPA: YCF48-related protein [Ignavibacteriaceae bacterium]|nr:YCF48-related protein [Ignavibacteriaceae bacterium]